uniref:Uncharacterized protein n=1 Tax=Rhizophora mucronata TaxID=61149 RepID=A0A2P2PQ61_RHIMU
MTLLSILESFDGMNEPKGWQARINITQQISPRKRRHKCEICESCTSTKLM